MLAACTVYKHLLTHALKSLQAVGRNWLVFCTNSEVLPFGYPMHPAPAPTMQVADTKAAQGSAQEQTERRKVCASCLLCTAAGCSWMTFLQAARCLCLAQWPCLAVHHVLVSKAAPPA